MNARQFKIYWRICKFSLNKFEGFSKLSVYCLGFHFDKRFQIFFYAICLLGLHLKLLSKNINQQSCIPRVLKSFIFRSKFFYEGFKKSEGERVKNFCQDFWKIFKPPLTLLQIKSLSPHSSISAFIFSITSCRFLPRCSSTCKQNKKIKN